MLDFVYVTPKCLCDIIAFFVYKASAYVCFFYRKGQTIGMASVVLTLVFHSNDIVVCQCFL